jgi:hypothetical protein
VHENDSKNEPMPTARILIILLLAAGILESAICVAAHSLGRRRGEAAVAVVQSQADDDRKEAADRIGVLEHKKADLAKQLDDLTKKFAATEKDVERLHHELDDAAKKIADLTQNQKYAEARIKRAEDAAAEARDAEHKAQLVAESVRRDTSATAAKAAAIKNDVSKNIAAKRDPIAAKNNKVAGGKRRGPVASLPRTSPSFSELDTDHDGRLTLKEYKAGFPDVTNAEELFKAMDTKGKGYLSLDEYKAGHPDPPVVSIKRPKKN